MSDSESGLKLIENEHGMKYIAFYNAEVSEFDAFGIELLLVSCFIDSAVSDIRLLHKETPWLQYANANYRVFLNPDSEQKPNRTRSLVNSDDLDSFLMNNGAPIQDLNRAKLSCTSNVMFSRMTNNQSQSATKLEVFFRLESIRNSYSKYSSASHVVLRPLRPVMKLNKLNAHQLVEKLVHMRSGMLIVAGPTGEGKSTLISSIVAERAFLYYDSIQTVENPIEYNLQHLKGLRSLITQHDVYNDHAQGVLGLITSFLRMHPGLIYLSEVRQGAEVSAVIHAQRTGHQVFTTTHANRAWSVLDKLIKQLPERVQLSELIDTLKRMGAIVCQKRLETKDMRMLTVQDILFFDQRTIEDLIQTAQSGFKETGEFSNMGRLLKDVIVKKTHAGEAITQEEHLRNHFSEGKIDEDEYHELKKLIVDE